MGNEEIIKMGSANLTLNYGRQPLAIVRGKNCHVWDADGKKYLDFMTGLATVNLGHCHPAVGRAVKKQIDRLWHISNIYWTEPQAIFARDLVKRLYKGRVFLCNSGTEANEAALKLARRHSTDNYGPDRTHVISFEGSFHGRTMGALSLTGQPKYHAGFGQMLPGVSHVPFGDLAGVKNAATDKTCAVIIEPVQGEIGVRVHGKKFMKELAAFCQSKNLLLIFDEVQTGFGRTGKLFAWQNYGVKPDIITLAKGIANGFPMGAMFAREDVAKSLVPGTHAATFGGNPLACAGAVAALAELTRPGFLENVRSLGEYAKKRLAAIKKKFPFIKEVRGMGLMIGIVLDHPCERHVKACAEKGLLVNCANGNVIRLLPPLTVKKAEVDRALSILEKVLGNNA
ncbi:MAG: aspartate aminotransferase family protein [Nitrospinae bacterium]|nr:aspartate aminotransferase family protein [Nitrospinota bacterium]